MLGLYHPMSSPQMTRMLGFFSSPKARPRAIIKSIRVINFAFINTARRDWLKSLPLTIKKSRPATMRLWSYSGTRLASPHDEAQKHEDDRRDDYAWRLTRKKQSLFHPSNVWIRPSWIALSSALKSRSFWSA